MGLTIRHRLSRIGLSSVVCLLLSLPVAAQETLEFDDIAAAAELEAIATLIQSEDVTTSMLADARSQVVRLETGATECAAVATAARARLEARFEPLRDFDSETQGGEAWDQRQAIKSSLDEATARQARCTGIVDNAKDLSDRITSVQNRLSQQYLSSRTDNVIRLLQGSPQRMVTWPSRIRNSLQLELVEGLTAIKLLWLLITAGIVFALVGLIVRRRFNTWYQAAGGRGAEPSLKYLVPKPLAEFAPLWLESAALVAVLEFSIAGASSELVVLRLAWALLAFALGCVVISWATGPLSPAATIQGLIPDHVRPIRIRLRFVLLTICFSFVVLGEQWAKVRISEPYVAGRALTIVLVGIALIVALDYGRQVPGLLDRFKVVRFIALLVTGLGIIAALVGFQNFAAFLVHGMTQTFVALFVMWLILWLVSIFLQYLLNQDTPTAGQVRASLGLSEGSRTGIGFMQLVADVVVWMVFAIYMIYVWDDSGTTLGQMYVDMLVGWEIGGVSLVPINIIGGILIFAGIIVVIGWLKRWIDKRWLQHIVMDRGARDAIITLFGYVGFVIALVVALFMAEVDLSGLAWVSAALALGIGFGMQEIAGNFVSGLILLFERPVRAGDFVTVGDVQGFVRRIRIRATEIETLDNRNVLVPNSELISGRVTNWVLRDTYGRLLVNVGVAYGSDVEKVRDILENAAREHPEVITDGSAPAPRALFMGFGDSSLDFELRVRVKHIERRFSIKSDLNFVIDKTFRESGVTVPFPQRDLHIISPPDGPAEGKKEVLVEDATPPSRIQGPGTRSHSEAMEISRDVEDVWAAITDIDILKRWVARDGSFSPHIGGAFNLALRDGYDVAGRLDVFIPPRRLRAVIVPLGDEPPLPTGPITIEMVVRAVDDCTRLTVTVSGIPDSEDWEEYYRLSVDRWKAALQELQKSVLQK